MVPAGLASEGILKISPLSGFDAARGLDTGVMRQLTMRNKSMADNVNAMRGYHNQSVVEAVGSEHRAYCDCQLCVMREVKSVPFVNMFRGDRSPISKTNLLYDHTEQR